LSFLITVIIGLVNSAYPILVELLYSYAMIAIIIWSIISVPMLGFGIKSMIKLFRNKDFSKKYSNTDNEELAVEIEILSNSSS